MVRRFSASGILGALVPAPALWGIILSVADGEPPVGPIAVRPPPAAAYPVISTQGGTPMAAATTPIPDSHDEPALPAQIPGFELRVLDLRKDVLFNVGGSWVKASVPIYVYLPTTAKDRTRAVEILRQVYGDMQKLGQQAEWSAADVRAILVNLDASLSLLEKK